MVSIARFIRILRYSSAWIAWFPVLFYSTIYIGDLYKRSIPPAKTDEEQTIIDERAMRLGSRALFYSALLSLIVSLVLPAFVAEAAGHPPQNQSSSWWQRLCRVPRGMQVRLVTMWATSQLVFAGCMFATLCVTSSLRLPCIVYWMPLLQFYSQRMGVHFYHHRYGLFVGYYSMGSILFG